MAQLPYMPLWVAEFLADTQKLDDRASWAYIAICMDYWLNGEPPRDDDAELARIARQPLSVWRRIRPTVERFFDCDENGFVSWRHGRVEAELIKAKAKSEKRAEAGRAGGQASRARARGSPPPAQANAGAIAPRLLKQSESESESKSIGRLDSVPRARSDGDDLVDRLVAAAGGNVVNGSTGIEVVRPILDLQAMGCDLELDILPAIKETVPKLDAPLRTWGARFVRDAVLAKQAARLRGRGGGAAAKTDPYAKDEAMWGGWWKRWTASGYWHADWGARPDCLGCRIPQHLRDQWGGGAKT